ncbi:MAG: DUF2281 domain-containing protein [Candidatus Desulfofervidaceae bacterium]|nr:DUF2281 domain-containing protein [Candidatus Desulfofervidaceae bacterium]
MQAVNQRYLDLEILPERARKELLDFYEYLLTKYKKDKEKKERLKRTLSNPVGILPEEYKFDREEAHER